MHKVYRTSSSVVSWGCVGSEVDGFGDRWKWSIRLGGCEGSKMKGWRDGSAVDQTRGSAGGAGCAVQEVSSACRAREPVLRRPVIAGVCRCGLPYSDRGQEQRPYFLEEAVRQPEPLRCPLAVNFACVIRDAAAKDTHLPGRV